MSNTEPITKQSFQRFMLENRTIVFLTSLFYKQWVGGISSQFFNIALFEGICIKNARFFAVIPSIHDVFPVSLMGFGWKNRMELIDPIFHYSERRDLVFGGFYDVSLHN